jgi:hypothetical protein
MYGSTCFGRPHAHHQGLNNYSSSLWFYRWSVVVAVAHPRLRPRGLCDLYTVWILKQRAHKLSNLLWRSIAAFLGKELKDAFSAGNRVARQLRVERARINPPQVRVFTHTKAYASTTNTTYITYSS